MNFKDVNWVEDKITFIEYLKSISEPNFKDFSSKTMPGVSMLGIRFPVLKSIAKEISKGDYESFLSIKDDGILEIKILKCYVAGNIKDIKLYRYYFDILVPTIDNWATCDCFLAASKIIRKDRLYFFDKVVELLKEDDEFKNRIAFVLMLDYFVDEEYIDRVYELIKDYKSDYYYANMGLAWLISGLFIKFPERTKSFLTTTKYDTNVLKPALQKIRDSYRVSESDKLWTKNIDLN